MLAVAGGHSGLIHLIDAPLFQQAPQVPDSRGTTCTGFYLYTTGTEKSSRDSMWQHVAVHRCHLGLTSL